jgi:O-acetyl-ADP-ribose deacetylase (regulator of RNase III)
MANISFVVGDATAPQGEGQKVVAHVCNDEGGWGSGFVVAVSRRWPEPEASYRRQFDEESPPELGTATFVRVTDDVSVANMVAQQGIRHNPWSGPAIRYDALRTCLNSVGRWALQINASVHMPRIGCGLAGGIWSEIEPIIREQLVDRGVDVVVYDWAGDKRDAVYVPPRLV